MSSSSKAAARQSGDSPRPARGRAWLYKLLLAVGTPLLFCLLLEGGLRLAGFGRNPDFFIPDEKPGFYRSNPRFTELFFPASFGLKPVNFRLPRGKPAGSIRVFVLGESAAMGVPEPAFALAPQLQAQLRAVHAGARIDVYNLGVTAINSHAILPVLRQALEFNPDLLVIYMGNNEAVGPYGSSSIMSRQPLPLPLIRTSLWLGRTRTGQLIQRVIARIGEAGYGFRDWRGMEMFADKAVAADDPAVQRVHDNFAANLTDMLAAARSAGVKVVLSTVAVNVRDCAPFVSLPSPGLTPAQRATWTEAWEEGRQAAARGENARVAAALNRAVAIDPGHAGSHFLLGASLDALLDDTAARAHFFAALERDGLRFRADGTINSHIRAAAKRSPNQVYLADVARELGADPAATAPPPGSEFFFEHVHLTWDGNYAVTRLLASASADALFGPVQVARPWLDSVACADAVGYTEFGRYSMLQSMDKLTSRPPFTGQLRYVVNRNRMARQLASAVATLSVPGALPAMTRKIHLALNRDPDSPDLLYQTALLDFQTGDKAGALGLLDRLSAAQPFSPEPAVLRTLILRSLGRATEAEPGLLRAIAEEPYYFQSYGLLVQIWSETGRTDEALAYIGDLLKRMPDSRQLRLTYAQLLALKEDWPAVESQWRAVLARTPDDEAVLGPLVKRLASTGRTAEAVALMNAAHTYNPRSFSTNKLLVEYHESRGDQMQAEKYREDLAASGPR